MGCPYICIFTDALCDCKVGYLAIIESAKMPATKPQCPENEKRGGGLWRVCSLEDIRKKLLRWERSPTALEAEAKALELEKPFSGSLNGDENKEFSSRNGGGDGPCAFQLPVHYPRYSKADYESMPKWQLDNLFHEYGLPIRGDLAFKRSYAMGTFLWPDQI